VQEAVPSPIAAWESFYVIVGSSGAALTGLQFVVIALVADSSMRTGSTELAAFGTPTIVHFCAALLVAATLSAPWHSLGSAALALGVFGVVGIAYTAIVIRRASRTTVYHPVFEDWLWHAVLPLASYLTILGAATALRGRAHEALFGVAAASVLLLFIGIHNAWDTVTYIALQQRRQRTTGAEPAAAAGAAEAPAGSPPQHEAIAP
jgi:hypothetical protein